MQYLIIVHIFSAAPLLAEDSQTAVKGEYIVIFNEDITEEKGMFACSIISNRHNESVRLQKYKVRFKHQLINCHNVIALHKQGNI